MMMLRVTVFTLLIAAGLCMGTAVPAASAHFVGSSWEITDGAYLVDIGYDTVSFTAGEYVRFDFALKDAHTEDPRDFAQVWVRMVHTRETLFATGLFYQPVGPTTLLYSFTESGAYSLEASYRTADGDEIASTTFPISVSSAPGGTLIFFQLLGTALGLFAAAGAGFWLGNHRRSAA